VWVIGRGPAQHHRPPLQQGRDIDATLGEGEAVATVGVREWPWLKLTFLSTLPLLG